jgi:hypothetical protein
MDERKNVAENLSSAEQEDLEHWSDLIYTKSYLLIVRG